MLDRSPNKGKFESKSRESVLLGYSEQSKGFRVWLPKEKKVKISRDIKFLDFPHTNFKENEISPNRAPGRDYILSSAVMRENQEIKPDDDITDQRNEHIHPDTDEEEADPSTSKRAPGRPRRILTGTKRRPRKQYNNYPANAAEEESSFLGEVLIQQAISSTDAEEWYDAMATELKSIINYGTWELVERPKNQKVIGSRIVLRNKFAPDGTLEKRKARIVAKEFTQRPGIDFGETFSPVTRFSSIRLMTALASRDNMTIHQLDVATAYLNGSLEERVYMEVPKLMVKILKFIIYTETRESVIKINAERMLNELLEGDKVCLLKKALYGLRQAGRQWHDRLSRELRNLGAIRSDSDACIYYKGQGGDLVMIAIYVDDILVASRNISEIEQIKAGLGRCFDVKDLGEIKHCLGLEFARNQNGYFIHQKGYVEILDRFHMNDCKPVSTPILSGRRLNEPTDDEDPNIQELPYREFVGSLMYLASATRPSVVSRVQNVVTKQHRISY